MARAGADADRSGRHVDGGCDLTGGTQSHLAAHLLPAGDDRACRVLARSTSTKEHQAKTVTTGSASGVALEARAVGYLFAYQRKPHPENGSALGGFGGNRAVMSLDDRTDDSQAQPVTRSVG